LKWPTISLDIGREQFVANSLLGTELAIMGMNFGSFLTLLILGFIATLVLHLFSRYRIFARL
jgi:hypothetical protein